MSAYYKKAYAFALRLSGCREDAEDLTQEAFMRAYRAFHRFDQNRPFDKWLYRIISNLFIDKLRARPAVNITSIDESIDFDNGDSFVPEIADYQYEPSAVIMRDVMDEDIKNALDSLPLPFRQTLILTDIEGLSYDETAKYLGCAAGTIRSRIHRARVMMRNYLKAKGYFGTANSQTAASR